LKTYCIYSHISPSKKIYIGQTSQIKNINKRWVNGDGYKRQSYFYNAIQKYGWDNFEHIILETNLSKEEADEREKYWISFYNSDNKMYGYNLTSGGSSEKILNDAAKENLIRSHEQSQGKSVLCLETGDLYSSERDAARSTNNIKNRSGIGECCNGKQYTAGGLHWCFSDIVLDYDTRMKMICDIDSQKEEKITQKCSKQIRCLETDTIYQSIREAERLTGISRCCIRDCLNGKQNSAGRHPITGVKLHWCRVVDN
jgi:group I intron endonuclease